MTQKQIIVVLHSNNLSLADWAIISENGERVQTTMQGTLQDLSSISKDCDVTILVPALDVLLTHASLPKLNRHKLLQALPYALEENLIDDVADLHFAIGDHQEDGTYPVAVVAKAKMQLWIDTLKAAGIEPMKMLPLTLALPRDEKNWHVYSYDNYKVVRTGKYSGFAADNSMFENILAVMPTDTNILRMPEASHQLLLEKIAYSLSSLSYINLLQPPYTAKRKITQTKNVWKYAGYLAAAWIVIAFIGNIVSLFILQYQASSMSHAIDQIYYQNFPHATSTVAPRERMEQKLKELTSAAQKNNFLSLLATVGKSLSHTKGIRLQSLDYRSGILTLNISSATFDNLDVLIRDLNANGLSVKQQNSATAGTQVKATLLINAGAS